MSHCQRAGRIRDGFSLLELTVSLVVGGMAVTGAAALLLGIASRADAIRSAALIVDRDANAERLIRLFIMNIDASADTTALRGNAESVDFPTWCETRFAWYERCRVRLAFLTTGDSRSLIVAKISDPARRADDGWFADSGVVLRDDVGSGHFLYLIDAAAGGRWSTNWSTLTLPAAIGLVMNGDTLILPVR